jgi:DNA-binding NarL/FixJ family response regulator
MSPLPGPTDGDHPATVAILTPHDVVAVGLRTILGTVLAGSSPAVRLLDAAEEEPEVLLYDVYALLDGDTDELDHWVKETASTVVALARPLRPDLGALALQRGAEAVVGLGSTAEEIIGVVRSACAGTLEDSEVVHAAEQETRLGETAGLSPRETEVLRLVTIGLSNQQIADELALSVNSIKTYIRSAYRKIGVSTRPQVVAWCVRHGFPPPVE